MTRRDMLAAAGVGALSAVLGSKAMARWEPSESYPDPSVQILDPSFEKYRIGLAGVERLATGMRWEEETGRVSVFRKPSNNANGNTRDRQGRLVTCEHDARRVSRTEYDGAVT